MKIYSGDTFKQDVEIYYNDGSLYEIKKEDIFLISFVDFENNVINEKKYTDLEGSKITVEYSEEEMENLKSGEYILQMKITTENFSQTYKTSVTVERGYRDAR